MRYSALPELVPDNLRSQTVFIRFFHASITCRIHAGLGVGNHVATCHAFFVTGLAVVPEFQSLVKPRSHHINWTELAFANWTPVWTDPVEGTCSELRDPDLYLAMWHGLTTTHRQTWIFSSTSTHHSTDLLTARGVAHLVVHGTSSSTSYETIPPVRLESSGGVLSTVDMVVQRRDGPRRLREHDDDDDDPVSLQYLTVCSQSAQCTPWGRKKKPIFFCVHLFYYLTETGDFFHIGPYIRPIRYNFAYLILACVGNFVAIVTSDGH